MIQNYLNLKVKGNKHLVLLMVILNYVVLIDDRQPVAVTDEELERINNSYDEGSGRKSYSTAEFCSTSFKKIKYICPKYWDISRSLSIRPDAVNKRQIADKVGRTKKSILERSGHILD